MDCVSSIDPSLELLKKSANDLRRYKVMVLKNKMKVLLISDTETDKSAVCLSVNVGSLSDPIELPGLAHFCEHMLFLGTKAFPTENTYSKYITEHGGHCNAFTRPDQTTYVFDVAPESLEEAVEIFSRFFVCPLFTDSATEREVNAVQSEHEKDISNDARRLFQLERTLSKSGHDYAKFFSGNRYSLFESSCAKSVNTREQLLQFHSTWYSANIMGLVILGKESINDLQKLAESKFSEVINRNVVRPSWNDTPWPVMCLKKMVYVVPLNDIHQMNIMWPIPDYLPNYAAQAPSYVTHLIGHESRGSLLSLFKKLGWANRLSCGVSRPGAGICSLIVSIDLTFKGLEKTDEMITNIYQYIKMLCYDEPQKWIFDEEQALCRLNFQFKDKEPPYDYVTQLAGNLLDYEMQDVLTGPFLATVYDPDLIKMILRCLTPDNSRRNRCPTNLEMPELLIETDMSRIWYFQDTEFNLPKGFITFHIVNPITFFDPLYAILAALYATLFEDHINELTYSSMLAGMTVFVKRTSEGIKLSFLGYTHKLKSFVKEIVTQLVNYYEPKVDRFECIREDMSREIANFKMKPAYQQSGVYLTNIILDRSWINEDYIQAFKDVTYEVMVNFIKQFYGQIFIEGLIYGNISEEDAISYHEMIQSSLVKNRGSKPLLLSHITMAREIILPEDSRYLYQRYISGQPASAVYYYLQCGDQSTLNDTLLNLFCQIVSEPAFNKLRTEQQLGYIVHAGLRRSNKLQGFRILVQSPHHPNDVEKSIEEFLLTVNKLLENMSEKDFDVHVQSLLTHLLEKPKGMQDRFRLLWSEVVCRHYNFKRNLHESNVLKSLKKNDVIDFFKKYIDPSSCKRRKLAIHILSKEKHDCDTESNNHNEKVIVLRDHTELKRCCALSALPKPFMMFTSKCEGNILRF
ncbi:Insulin-degrading enzyme [Schistosoma japonicum]|uniref:Insulin-degrading enzyme n=1 Tax=Schistosoma japonicum TaxID=6182 RepID=A0A4Z2DNX6_SCHJA|nr:Insulin-degrading enzyme [Schistosoma japonicum]